MTRFSGKKRGSRETAAPSLSGRILLQFGECVGKQVPQRGAGSA